MATVDSASHELLSADPNIVNAIVGAVDNCFAMCDVEVHTRGINTLPSGVPGPVTGMIGVHGKVSGFITVNMAQRAALTAVGGLLQEKVTELNSQVIDGVGEIANIIGGGVKGKLAGTPWSFINITVPSVIVGQNYQIAYARGLQFVSILFEMEDPAALLLDDRLLRISISLLRL